MDVGANDARNVGKVNEEVAQEDFLSPPPLAVTSIDVHPAALPVVEVIGLELTDTFLDELEACDLYLDEDFFATSSDLLPSGTIPVSESETLVLAEVCTANDPRTAILDEIRTFFRDGKTLKPVPNAVEADDAAEKDNVTPTTPATVATVAALATPAPTTLPTFYCVAKSHSENTPLGKVEHAVGAIPPDPRLLQRREITQ